MPERQFGGNAKQRRVARRAYDRSYQRYLAAREIIAEAFAEAAAFMPSPTYEYLINQLALATTPTLQNFLAKQESDNA